MICINKNRKNRKKYKKISIFEKSYFLRIFTIFAIFVDANHGRNRPEVAGNIKSCQNRVLETLEMRFHPYNIYVRHLD